MTSTSAYRPETSFPVLRERIDPDIRDVHEYSELARSLGETHHSGPRITSFPEFLAAFRRAFRDGKESLTAGSGEST